MIRLNRYPFIFLFILLMGQATWLPGQGFQLSVSERIQSGFLKEERNLNIYLPPEYTAEPGKKFPVIYLLDGGIGEDFIHLTGLARLNSQPWINRLPASIVVGIEGINRRKDFTHPVKDLSFLGRMGLSPEQIPAYGGSPAFIAFLEKELQPFVNQHYRTNGSAMIIGESMGGLLATEILLKHRQLFDTYIIISPSLWWGEESLLREAPGLLAEESPGPVRVYVGASDRKESEIMYQDAVALSELLRVHGKDKIRVIFDYLPEETHGTILHQAVSNAFKKLAELP